MSKPNANTEYWKPIIVQALMDGVYSQWPLEVTRDPRGFERAVFALIGEVVDVYIDKKDRAIYGDDYDGDEDGKDGDVEDD